MSEWGIPKDNHIALRDWVGGRYSLWSGIGLPIALKIGMQGFKELLAGAEAMDQHYRHTEFSANLPVLLALIGVWNINPFDQWGVELGKKIAKNTLSSIEKAQCGEVDNTAFDSSTAGLLNNVSVRGL